MQFMQIHFMTNKDQEKMRTIFHQLDKNFDGVLSKEEVINGFEMMGYDNP